MINATVAVVINVTFLLVIIRIMRIFINIIDAFLELNNRVVSDTTIELNSHYELNSLYVNEPGLYAIILGSKKPKGDEQVYANLSVHRWACTNSAAYLHITGLPAAIALDRQQDRGQRCLSYLDTRLVQLTHVSASWTKRIQTWTEGRAEMHNMCKMSVSMYN